MQFSCCFCLFVFPEKPKQQTNKTHSLKKFPPRANKDKGQILRGMMKGSYLPPLALQRFLKCFPHIHHTNQEKVLHFSIAFHLREDSTNTSRQHATPARGDKTWVGAETAWVGVWGAEHCGERHAEIIIPLCLLH